MCAEVKARLSVVAGHAAEAVYKKRNGKFHKLRANLSFFTDSKMPKSGLMWSRLILKTPRSATAFHQRF